jgi:hypothetical protein
MHSGDHRSGKAIHMCSVDSSYVTAMCDISGGLSNFAIIIYDNNKLIAHNVQGLDIISSEDYAQNKIESEKLFSPYTP